MQQSIFQSIHAPMQFVCASAQELYYEVLQAICHAELIPAVKNSNSIGSGWGTRERPTKELRYATLVLENPRDRLIDAPMCFLEKIIPRTILATLSDELDVSSLEFYDAKAREFSEDGIKLTTNYGYRIQHLNGINQIKQVITQFKEDPNTRRAVIHIHSPEDSERKYNPCINSIHFLIRNGALECQTFWRSENALTLLPVNLFEFTMLQELIASELEIPVGQYVHSVTSLHCYSDDEQRLQNSLGSLPFCQKPDVMDPMTDHSMNQITILRKMEQQLRSNESAMITKMNEYQQLSNYWQEIGEVIAYTIAKKNKQTDLARFLRNNSRWEKLLQIP